jgi:hypothetical protein
MITEFGTGKAKVQIVEANNGYIMEIISTGQGAFKESYYPGVYVSRSLEELVGKINEIFGDDEE